LCSEGSSRRVRVRWASSGEVAVRVGGTEEDNNPTPSPSFRGAGAEAVAMVTTAPWSGDFSLSSPPFALLQAAAIAARSSP
jgi:hypothetical protein